MTYPTESPQGFCHKHLPLIRTLRWYFFVGAVATGIPTIALKFVLVLFGDKDYISHHSVQLVTVVHVLGYVFPVLGIIAAFLNMLLPTGVRRELLERLCAASTLRAFDDDVFADSQSCSSRSSSSCSGDSGAHSAPPNRRPK